ncbi:BTB/POZ and MATH domain-containing protein 2-like [Carex rostrata]
MENSDSVNYIKVSHHFKFNCLPMKNQHLEEFVSSPVFRALGNEWIIDYYYPPGSRLDGSGLYSIAFLVKLHGKYLKGGLNPTFSFSIMKRDGTTYTLSHEHLKGGVAVEKGRAFAFGEYRSRRSTFWTDFVKNGSFELICSIDNTNIPQNRCSLGVPKSFDWHSHFGKLLESSESADVDFHVENRSFLCHRLILVARSPVFKAMLFGNMAEATQQQIKIADMCPKVFEAMLHFIYTDSFPSCNSDKASTKLTVQLFEAADRYALEGLKELCEDELCSNISLDTVTTTLAFALQHNSPWLKNSCLDFITEPETLTSWTLSDEYVDFIRSFPSMLAEIRDRRKERIANSCSIL